MLQYASKLKEKMLELTRLFCIERSIFQKLVIIYQYIRLLNKDPLAKSILQKIFDDTIKSVGVKNADCFDENEFLDVSGEAIFTKDFWQYFSNLETIHNRMKKMKDCQACDKSQYSKLRKLFSKPYSKAMFKLSFEVINSEVFERMDQECFFSKKADKVWFDEKRSILYIQDKKILINKQKKINDSHKILKYIFITNKNNLTDDFFFSEIASDEFGDFEYASRSRGWEKYRTACRRLQDNIRKQTNGIIGDFLIFNTGKTGKVKINKKYL